MGVKEIIEILQKSELDRETKLKIVDFLSVSNDQQKINDLSDLLTAWQAVDNAEEQGFKDQLAVIMQTFEKDVQKVESAALLSEQKIANELETTTKIEALRKQLSL